jgi:uncharacterized protein (DUF1697 family)
VDVIVVGSPDWKALAKKINEVEAEFGREVNYSVYSREEFEKKKNAPFLKRVLSGKMITLVERC